VIVNVNDMDALGTQAGHPFPPGPDPVQNGEGGGSREPTMTTETLAEIVAANAAERERLAKVLADLSDADLARSIGSGWTIATILAHLAFWDQWALLRIERWERERLPPSPTDVEMTNLTLRAISAAIPPRAAAALALASAEAVDRKVAELSPELAGTFDEAGFGRNLRRSLHRREHLARVAEALAGQGGPPLRA
jgi:hypothetical protein